MSHATHQLHDPAPDFVDVGVGDLDVDDDVLARHEAASLREDDGHLRRRGRTTPVRLQLLVRAVGRAGDV